MTPSSPDQFDALPIQIRRHRNNAGSGAPIPTPLSAFIGRTREVDEISTMLLRTDIRLVTLTGPGGSGKTRLAIQTGQALSNAFESVWYVALDAVRDSELVVSTIARALGIRETGERSLWDRLISHCADQTALLILDNFEQVVQAGPRLTELLSACPTMKLLITSRIVLRVTGEHDYPVPPLAIPLNASGIPLDQLAQADGIALFVDRAQAADPHFRLTLENAPIVFDVCARLEGLPLAIELAAAHSRMLSPSALRNRLADRLSLLSGGPQDQPHRLQSMRNALEWSYDLLDQDKQRLFRRFAIFVGGASEEAIRTICAGDDNRDRPMMEQLEALIDASLLSQVQMPDGEPRFQMLETIREFGRERLNGCGEESEIRRAHGSYYLRLARDAESRLIISGAATWVERLASEWANLRDAVYWALESGNHEDVLGLSGTLLSFAYARGEPNECLEWLEAALADRAGASARVQADALFTASALAQVLGDFSRSNELCELSIEIAVQGDYPFGEARALLGLGITAEWGGDFDQAADLYGRAQELMSGRDRTDRLSHWEVLPTANLADLSLLREDLTRATMLGEEAVTCWRASGYLWGIAQALGTVAAAACERGDRNRSALLYTETLDLWLSCNDGRGIAGTIAGIAAIVAQRGQLERAARLLGSAWGLRDHLGVRFVAHHVYAERVLASVRARLGEPTFSTCWATGHAMTFDESISEARTALMGPDPPVHMAHDITNREMDVLRLIARGLSDREIASTLYISPRTVQTHVAGLLDKLDAASRAEAAAIAVRRGLV